MVEKELLQVLICPQSQQSMHEAPPGLLARLNALVERGELVNQGGAKLAVPLAEVLVREDGKVAYPVLDGIPMLIAEEALAIP